MVSTQVNMQEKHVPHDVYLACHGLARPVGGLLGPITDLGLMTRSILNRSSEN